MLADEGSSLFVHLFVVTENKNSNSVHHHRVIRVSRTTAVAPSHYYSHHQPATMHHSTHARTAPGLLTLTPKGVPGPRAPSAIASNRAIIGRLMTGIVRLVIGVIVDHPRRNKHATFGRFFTHDLTIFKERCRPILSHPDHWVSSRGRLEVNAICSLVDKVWCQRVTTHDSRVKVVKHK